MLGTWEACLSACLRRALGSQLSCEPCYRLPFLPGCCALTPVAGGGQGPGVMLAAVAHPLWSPCMASATPHTQPVWGLTVFCFWSLKHITWARRRQTGLISPGMPALTGSGTTGATQSPPPRSEALPGTAIMTTMNPPRRACGSMRRVVQAATPQPRNTGTTVTTGGTRVATLVRSQVGVLLNPTLETWVATRPGLTLSPALARPCRKKASLGTPALLTTPSRPALPPRTTIPPKARRAPGRPTLDPPHHSQSQKHSRSCKAGRQGQGRSRPKLRSPGRHPQQQPHARPHRSSSHRSSSNRHKVLSRSGYSSKARWAPGAQPLPPASRQESLSQVQPRPQGPYRQEQ